jgi:hypothetical protein
MIQIEREFAAMYRKECDAFIAKFPTIYAPKIIKYTERTKPYILQHLDGYSGELRALDITML